MTARSRETMRLAARYAPGLSWPIVDLIAEEEFGTVRSNSALLDAMTNAVHGCESRQALAALFGDLICALNGTDWLPAVAGLVMGLLLTERTE